jgi:hypothetical protein
MPSLTQVLDAVDAALGVLKSLADTPGINMLPYVSTVSAAIGAVKAGVAAGKNVMPYVEAIKETFEGGVPSQEKLSALDAKIAELEAEVDATLPAKEAGEPD